MPENQHPMPELVSGRTRRRIMGGVSAGHLLVLVLVLTFSVVSEWLDKPEDTISVEFYDPALNNVVENPSPDPSPDNPIPPSGTPDGGNAPETPEPEPEPVQPVPEPPKQIVPDTAEAVVQPTVTQRKLPRKASKPKQVVPSQRKAVKQPKITKRKRPGRNKNKKAPAEKSRKNDLTATGSGKPGPRGSNREAGHTAPGGQRGNSGYDQLVAGMIYRMWATPDVNRLGGRKPQVGIELIIAADGRVIGKRITHRSGVLAMDESIQNLLDNLRQVIVPFDRKQHILRFALKAE